MLVLLPMITLRSRCNEACTSHGNHACHAPGGLRELRRRTDPALLPCLLLRKLDCRFGLLAFVSARRGRIGQEAEVACSFPVWFSSSDKQRVAFDQQRRRRLFALCQRNRISSSSSSSSSSSIAPSKASIAQRKLEPRQRLCKVHETHLSKWGKQACKPEA